jgi:magnesium-transporting ATPase (P-type)
VYFFLLIGGSYLFLYFCMKLTYNRDLLPSPWNVMVANILMTIMVPISLTFRQLMNKLSEMRRPNTQTNRTLFIVITTVLFHFIYYIIIPTFYLKSSKD